MGKQFGHGLVGDTLFSFEDGRRCLPCGWATFWARGGNFEVACCERCGARVSPPPAPSPAEGGAWPGTPKVR